MVLYSAISTLLVLAAAPAQISVQCPAVQPVETQRSIAKVQQPGAIATGSKAEPVRSAQVRRPASVRGSAPSPANGEVESGSSGFVADEIGGVFEAITDSSIKQMEAYGEMVSNVSKSTDEFMAENVSEPTTSAKLSPKQSHASKVLCKPRGN